MKLKLYLRGLGVGLLIGAIALLIFGGVDVGSKSDSASDSSAVGLITPVEETDESEENEVTLYATAYPLEDVSTSEESSEVSDEGEEALTTIDEELTSTSDSISETDDETQEAISQVLAKTSDAQSGSKQSQDASTNESTEIEVEDGEAFVVSDDADTTDTSKTSTSKSSTSGTDTNSESESTNANTDTDTASDESDTEDTTETTTTTTGNSVVVQIPGGSDSATVCKVLQNAGAIESASDFDAYLVSRGIDRYIRSGTYYITAGSTYEEIAKLITGR
ncbi:MAG: hypothetical protein K6G87_13760 [Butyrivibrio sp.]|uniref:hypothetical protein n=1 Tax=Butyrivibrio sp. TaxID=28121 RepID=UPI0025E297AD|nr:hypothetical protein [Butyrivibrio sp.]MCR5772283.1 hypothetical protein [Butyrivibrio sp.]